jgi:hypothetical protein
VTWVVPVNIATSRSGRAISAHADCDGDLAISPDGRTAYLYDYGVVVPISMRNGKVLKPIVAGGKLTLLRLEIDPYGRIAYADTLNNRLLPINTVTNTPLSRIGVPADYSEGYADPAFDASGSVLYWPGVITRRGQPQEGVLMPVDTATQHFGKIIDVGPGSPQRIVIVP